MIQLRVHALALYMGINCEAVCDQMIHVAIQQALCNAAVLAESKDSTVLPSNGAHTSRLMICALQLLHGHADEPLSNTNE